MTFSRGKDHPNYRHGGCTEHRAEYNSWRAMKARCDDRKYHAYHRYGGRGISYCKRWKVFSNFLKDMGKKPSSAYSLDRIDNDGEYCPENCRWATQKEQMRNSTKKTQAKITSEMLAESKVCASTVYKRVQNGWTVEKATSNPPENPYEILRARALLSHNECPVCGAKCPHKRDRYCCKEHFWQSRGKDGRFTKGVSCDERQDKKEQERPTNVGGDAR